jgi:hypothetical protein
MPSRGASEFSYIGYVLVALLSLALGMGIGMFVFPQGKSGGEKGTYEKGYNDAMTEAEKKLQERGLIPQDSMSLDSENAEMFVSNVYNGEVTELQDDAISISFPAPNLLEDDIVKTFPIDSSTQVVLQKAKDYIVFEEELAQYQASLEEATESEEGAMEDDDEVFFVDAEAMPQPFVEEGFFLSQMRVGDNVEILMNEGGDRVEKITVFSSNDPLADTMEGGMSGNGEIPSAPEPVEVDPQNLPEAPEAL